MASSVLPRKEGVWKWFIARVKRAAQCVGSSSSASARSRFDSPTRRPAENMLAKGSLHWLITRASPARGPAAAGLRSTCWRSSASARSAAASAAPPSPASAAAAQAAIAESAGVWPEAAGAAARRRSAEASAGRAGRSIRMGSLAGRGGGCVLTPPLEQPPIRPPGRRNPASSLGILPGPPLGACNIGEGCNATAARVAVARPAAGR